MRSCCLRSPLFKQIRFSSVEFPMINIMRVHVRILLALLPILLIACSSVSSRPPDGQVVTITVFNGSYEAVVAAQPANSSNGTIKIFMTGQVVTPGAYDVPVGTTMLQAIQRADGFTPLAAAKDALVIDKSGKKIRPGLHRLSRLRKLPLVWYGNPNCAQDFVLEDGMRIEVPIYL
jgi:hypothetical protein